MQNLTSKCSECAKKLLEKGEVTAVIRLGKWDVLVSVHACKITVQMM